MTSLTIQTKKNDNITLDNGYHNPIRCMSMTLKLQKLTITQKFLGLCTMIIVNKSSITKSIEKQITYPNLQWGVEWFCANPRHVQHYQHLAGCNQPVEKCTKDISIMSLVFIQNIEYHIQNIPSIYS